MDEAKLKVKIIFGFLTNLAQVFGRKDKIICHHKLGQVSYCLLLVSLEIKIYWLLCNIAFAYWFGFYC